MSEVDRALSVSASTRFVLFGERHTGTNYTRRKLVEAGLSPVEDLGFKHWFIPGVEGHVPNETTDYEAVRGIETVTDEIFVLCVRDPLPWAEAMHREPYHIERLGTDDLQTFATSRVTSRETERRNERWPISTDGYWIESADSLARLWSEKYRHWLRLRGKGGGFFIVHFESIDEDIRLICEALGVAPPDLSDFFKSPTLEPSVEEALQVYRTWLDHEVGHELGYEATAAISGGGVRR